MFNDDFSRSEQATPKHRAEARSKGMVAKSMEISSVATILAGLIAFIWLGSYIGHGLVQLTKILFSNVRYGAVSMPGSEVFLLTPTIHVFGGTLVWTGIIFAMTLIVGFAQVGFEGTTWTMKWENLNPLNGMKRLISLSNLVRTLVAVVKLAFIILLSKGVIQEALKSDLFSRAASPAEVVLFMSQVVISLSWRVIFVLSIIAFIDYLYQRWHHEKNLRMTKEEVKEEGKQSEGNPMVKQKVRRMMLMRVRSRMMQDVPKATVVITNPTHVAIALQYDRNKMKAPKVVAKGLRLVAQKIKEIARENQVPMFENKPLARGLYRHSRLGSEIPAIYYEAVATILAQVYRLEAQKRKQVTNVDTPPLLP